MAWTLWRPALIEGAISVPQPRWMMKQLTLSVEAEVAARLAADFVAIWIWIGSSWDLAVWALHAASRSH